MTQETKKKAATRDKAEKAEVKSSGYKIEKKRAPGREEVEVLGATFEEGKPEDMEMGRWRQKLGSRAEKLKYLETGERYWFGKEWYGSEKRKTPA